MKKKRKYLMVLLAMALLLAALTPAAAASHRRATRTVAPVTWFTEPDRPIGVSMLTRTDDAVRFWFATSELEAREAITIWWIVFNNPDGCSDPCSPDDIFVDGDASLGFDLAAVAASDAVGGYSTGRVTNALGWVFMTDRLGEGDVGDEIIVGEGPILKDARTAEVHLVARTHGPAIPGLVSEQLGSYGGGCDTFYLPGTYPTGVGGCSDIQSSIHLP
jgi:hypothetical protein